LVDAGVGAVAAAALVVAGVAAGAFVVSARNVMAESAVAAIKPRVNRCFFILN
jgi:hypothetical protein